MVWKWEDQSKLRFWYTSFKSAGVSFTFLLGRLSNFWIALNNNDSKLQDLLLAYLNGASLFTSSLIFVGLRFNCFKPLLGILNHITPFSLLHLQKEFQFYLYCFKPNQIYDVQPPDFTGPSRRGCLSAPDYVLGRYCSAV